MVDGSGCVLTGLAGFVLASVLSGFAVGGVLTLSFRSWRPEITSGLVFLAADDDVEDDADEARDDEPAEELERVDDEDEDGTFFSAGSADLFTAGPLAFFVAADAPETGVFSLDALARARTVALFPVVSCWWSQLLSELLALALTIGAIGVCCLQVRR